MQNKYFKNILFATPAAIMTAGIIILSHQPEPPFIDSDLTFQDKILHFSGYLIYGLTLVLAFSGVCARSDRKKWALMVILTGCIFALTDEAHQSFVPGRSADLFDWLADCAGIAASLLFIKPVGAITSGRANKK